MFWGMGSKVFFKEANFSTYNRMFERPLLFSRKEYRGMETGTQG